MIQLYTGEGKGKTTAAVGQAVRAAGNGYPVAFAQFMKGRESGEIRALSAIPEIQILRSGKDFGFYGSMSGAQKGELTEIHNGILDRLLELAGSGRVFLMVLDEITYPVKWGLLDLARLEKLLAYAKGSAGASEESGKGFFRPEIVLTGRDPAQFLWDSADYVTCMECVRHPYEQGVRARRGIEF